MHFLHHSAFGGSISLSTMFRSAPFVRQVQKPSGLQASTSPRIVIFLPVMSASSSCLSSIQAVIDLSLSGTSLADAGIKPLFDLTNLKRLDLRKTKVTAAKIDELKDALPKCRIEWDGGVIEP